MVIRGVDKNGRDEMLIPRASGCDRAVAVVGDGEADC